MVGQIAGLIAAVAFVALVGVLAIPLVKLGRVLDTTTQSIRELTEHSVPILDESATAIGSANTQLEKVDTITTAAAEVSQNVSALTGLYAAAFGAPIVKVAAFSYGVRTAVGQALSRVRGRKDGTASGKAR